MNNKRWTGISGVFSAATLSALMVLAPGHAEAKGNKPVKKVEATAIKMPLTPTAARMEAAIDKVQAGWQRLCGKVEPEREAYVAIDSRTGETLIHKDETARVQIASMTKLMTALLAMEAIQDPDSPIQADQLVKIETSWNRRPDGNPITKLVTGWTKSVPLMDVISAAVVGSKNDAAVTLAKIVAGSEESFVKLMNKRAVELGLDITFYNATGLPAKDVDHLGDSVNPEAKTANLISVAKLHKYIQDHQPQLVALLGSQDIKLQGHTMSHTLKKVFQSVMPSFSVPWGKSGFSCLPGYSGTVEAGNIILTYIGAKTQEIRENRITDLLHQAQRMRQLNTMLPMTLKIEPLSFQELSLPELPPLFILTAPEKAASGPLPQAKAEEKTLEY